MVPPPALLTDVLPTERLGPSGKPLPPLRAELRRIADRANAVSLAMVWVSAIAAIVGAAAWNHPLGWLAAFAFMGTVHTRLGVLSHEAAHRLLFSRQRLNDFAGRWLTSYPTFISFDGYRRGHFAHHRDPLGPDEPDLILYRGYPMTRASLGRKLRRDALFVSGTKIMRQLVAGFWTKPRSRDRVLRIFGTQAVLLAAFALSGRPELYPLLWVAPWMTVTRVTARLRAIGEHGGLIPSTDHRNSTHHARQSRWAQFWMVPYNTGWHLAHHVDMGVPWRNLPALHAELVAAGYVVDELVYPNYRALWRAAISRG
jgi:fatty acid desaturase